MQHFSDQLITKARTDGHSLCVGLDPHLAMIPPAFCQGSMKLTDPKTPAAIESFLKAIVAQVAERAIALKPQIAFFEPMGSAGIAALENVLRDARGHVSIIMDAKRGDIGSTAAAYAAAYLTPGAPLESDALTINPYLGSDSLEPFIKAAETHGKGLFVLVKTSNPG